MCGRYGLFHNERRLQGLFDVVNPQAFALEPRYNIAPTSLVPLVFSDRDERRRAGKARWGLVPHWVDSPASWNASTFNARSEEVRDKPTFRDAFRRGRVLIPASGFFEWKRDEGGKTPHFVRSAHHEPLAFAGLMDVWRSDDGRERLVSCTILTTAPNAEMAPLHDRMPVLLHLDDFDLWLDRSASPDDAQELLEPAPDGDLEAFAVSSAVNRVGNDGPGLIEPASG